MLKSTELGRLLPHTLELLENRSRSITLQQIESDTGLPIAWLRSLSQTSETMKTGPSVVRIEKLYEYLSKRELTL